MNSLRIGEVAQRTGVPIDTIRYYEREGLIPAPPRRPSGYREYPPDTLSRLRFIRRAKVLGFTLEDIAELLRLSARRDVHSVKRAAEQRLTDIESRIAQLQSMRRGLRKLVEACPGHGGPEQCPIVQALAGPEELEDAR